MFKNLSLIVFVAIVGHTACGQNVLTQVSIPKGVSFKNVSSQALGNRVLIGYDDRFPQQEWRFSCYTTTPKGALGKIDLTKNEFSSIIGGYLVNAEAGKIFYLTEKNKKSFVNELEINLRTGSKTPTQKQVQPKGRMIGSVAEEQDLKLFSIESGVQKSLIVTNIGEQGVFETSYDLPAGVGSLLDGRISFISSSSFASVSQALEEVKIIYSKEAINIIIDHTENDTGDKKGTWLIRIDVKSNEITNRFFEEPALKNNSVALCRSYVCDQYLFRTLHQRKSFTFKVFDCSSGELVYTRGSTRDSISDQVFVNYRTDKDPPIKKTLSGLITAPIPFVMVSKDSASGKFNAVCGTHREDSKFVGPVWISPLHILASIMVTSIMQLTRDSGDSFYFYYVGDVSKGFEFFADDPENRVRQKIDSYEMINKPGSRAPRYENLSFCFYRKGVAGVYYDRTDKMIKVIEFSPEAELK